MKEQIAKLLEVIIADYNATIDSERMQKEFAEQLVVKEGRKYVKVCTHNGRSVWGFIVNTDNDPHFQYGDILKAASYDAPARNQARGNVFDDEYQVRWTGPLYL